MHGLQIDMNVTAGPSGDQHLEQISLTNPGVLSVSVGGPPRTDLPPDQAGWAKPGLPSPCWPCQS